MLVNDVSCVAQQVGAGDLDIRVIEDESDDEIGMLGRYFNQMTRQLKGQRDTLLDNNRQIERRRRLFDSVQALFVFYVFWSGQRLTGLSSWKPGY